MSTVSFILSALFIFFSRPASAEVAPAPSPTVTSIIEPSTTTTVQPLPVVSAVQVSTPAPVASAVITEKAEYIGATACLACHDNKQDTGLKNPHGFTRLEGKDFEKSCEVCHGPGSLHASAAGDKSNPAFASINSMKGDVSATCFQCHQDQRRTHWAGGVHESRGMTCTTCHSVHSPKSPARLLQQVDEKTLCFQCHKDVKSELHRNSHMPVLEGKMSCGDCHNPHGSATSKMLVSDNVNQLCFKCHAEKRGPFLWTHAPVEENCLTCHSPHGSHNDKMLVAKAPMLCQRCHALGGSHNGSAFDESQVLTQQNRLADKACINCHTNIHGSNHPSGKFFQR